MVSLLSVKLWFPDFKANSISVGAPPDRPRPSWRSLQSSLKEPILLRQSWGRDRRKGRKGDGRGGKEGGLLPSEILYATAQYVRMGKLLNQGSYPSIAEALARAFCMQFYTKCAVLKNVQL